jgi:hypothetical protein
MMSTQETKPDFFELGDKTSLICADGAAVDQIRSSLKELGFKCHIADTPDTGIERLRYTPYDCVIIHETFGGRTLRTNSVLSYLSGLPMSQRRYSFTCAVGPSLKTLDAMQAFSLSVHLVVDPANLPNLTAILRKGLADFESTYRVYREALAAQGVL